MDKHAGKLTNKQLGYGQIVIHKNEQFVNTKFKKLP